MVLSLERASPAAPARFPTRFRLRFLRTLMVFPYLQGGGRLAQTRFFRWFFLFATRKARGNIWFWTPPRGASKQEPAPRKQELAPRKQELAPENKNQMISLAGAPPAGREQARTSAPEQELAPRKQETRYFLWPGRARGARTSKN